MNTAIKFVIRNFSTIGILIGAFFVWRTVKGVFNPSSKDSLGYGEKLDVTKSKLTLNDIQIKSVAEQIYNATVTEGLKDTYKLLISPFKMMQSQEDFNAVYNYFGKRQYSMFWGNVGDPITSDKHDMITIITAELSSDQLDDLRRLNPKISF